MMEAIGVAIGTFILMSLFAFVVQALVEAGVGKLLDIIETWLPSTVQIEKIFKTVKVLQFGIAMLVGYQIALLYSFDVFYAVSLSIPGYDLPQLQAGVTLTGFAIGMGSSFIHEIFERYILNRPVEVK